MPKKKPAKTKGNPAYQKLIPKRYRTPGWVKNISHQEFRVLQRIQNRIHDEEELKKEKNLTKILVEQTGYDYEKCQWVLQKCNIPHTCEQLAQHPLFPQYVKGVHLITFVLEDGPLTLKFDIIFKPHNGKLLAYGYRIIDKSGNS